MWFVCTGDVRILSTQVARSPIPMSTYTETRETKNMMHTKEDAIKNLAKGSRSWSLRLFRFQGPQWGDVGKGSFDV